MVGNHPRDTDPPPFPPQAAPQALNLAATARCHRVSNGSIPTGACAAEGPILRGFDAVNLSSTLQISAAGKHGAGRYASGGVFDREVARTKRSLW